MLTVENLYFSYPNQGVLKGISFGVEPGELICLLGENGAGKTTLLKCIMGFLRGYDGGISIGGTAETTVCEAVGATGGLYSPGT